MEEKKKAKLNLFMVAGEASADKHAASLLRELKKMCPSVNCFGVGGKALRAEGMEVVLPSSDLNVVGLTDWVDKVPSIYRSYRELVQKIKRRKPDLAVLLDLPDFNLMLAKHLRDLEVPVVYYISPQVWAWRKYRVRKISKRVQKMLVVFPFEKDFYESHGVSAEFVGHPLLDSLHRRSAHRNSTEILESPKIAVLPGSRTSEVKHHAPVLRESAKRIRKSFPNAEFFVPVANTLSTSWVREQMGTSFQIHDGAMAELVTKADIALVASGTATLETALIGTPFCLFYRVSRFSAWVFKHIVRYRRPIGMPNLLIGEPVIKEYFQDDLTSENLYLECHRLISDRGYREFQSKALDQCRTVLGGQGASFRAAKQVLSAI